MPLRVRTLQNGPLSFSATASASVPQLMPLRVLCRWSQVIRSAEEVAALTAEGAESLVKDKDKWRLPSLPSQVSPLPSQVTSQVTPRSMTERMTPTGHPFPFFPDRSHVIRLKALNLPRQLVSW